MIEERLKEALKFMQLTPFVTYHEIKKRYKELSKQYHPDISDDSEKMQKLNESYEILKKYIDNYRFSFSKEEIQKQYLGNDYAEQFRF